MITDKLTQIRLMQLAGDFIYEAHKLNPDVGWHDLMAAMLTPLNAVDDNNDPIILNR